MGNQPLRLDKDLERIVQPTEYGHRNKCGRGPLGQALPWGCCGGIVNPHLLFETCEHKI